MRIAVLDDEAIYQEMISNIVSAYDSNIEIISFYDANDLVEYTEIVDLLLLDVEMPTVNGITFAKDHIEEFPYIIFVTSHEEYVYDCFGTNVIGFVSKHKLQEQLVKQVNKFQSEHLLKVSFTLKDGVFNVDPHKIYSIYLKDGCIFLKLRNTEIYVIERSIKEVMKKMPNHLFYIVNRQSIISFSKVRNLDHKSHIVYMKNGDIVKVSRRIWSVFYEAYIRWLESC